MATTSEVALKELFWKNITKKRSDNISIENVRYDVNKNR